MNSEEITDATSSDTTDTPKEGAVADDAGNPTDTDSASITSTRVNDEGGKTGEEPSAGTEDHTDLDEEDDDEDGETTEGLRRKLDHMVKARRKTNAENQTLRNRLKKAEHELNAYKVAAELNVPTEFASRLAGDTIEDLKADANKLLESLQRFGYVGDFGLGTNFPESQSDDVNPLSPEALDSIGARMYRR